ncbi:hypothetical protein AMTRI_Chr10g400 [Amborella trichopoda]|uniref:BHLH domain-containing protein n=1 Tax=Amborella trichopoda TaxID=13333 RepID=W1NWE3_AMBTC|nr:uncharacterized protein LOC18427991 [Amborella trichopoda]ERM99947.1 hypothetical protein AMTR_s00110p00112890 [Amborella trichopoda]|eukprot:XP_006837094.1 uncharacterized protein LOC18427991 [Amborella trichopoda]
MGFCSKSASKDQNPCNVRPFPTKNRRKNGRKTEKMAGKESVEKKLVALQRLLPAGKSMKGDRIFEETAEYIVLLRTQVQILQKLVDLYSNGGCQCKEGG